MIHSGKNNSSPAHKLSIVPLDLVVQALISKSGNGRKYATYPWGSRFRWFLKIVEREGGDA